ncbi:MAG: hypothetical protein ACRCYS_12380, partial [Beijerinckiaceae bacterium]
PGPLESVAAVIDLDDRVWLHRQTGARWVHGEPAPSDYVEYARVVSGEHVPAGPLPSVAMVQVERAGEHWVRPIEHLPYMLMPGSPGFLGIVDRAGAEALWKAKFVQPFNIDDGLSAVFALIEGGQPSVVIEGMNWPMPGDPAKAFYLTAAMLLCKMGIDE